MWAKYIDRFLEPRPKELEMDRLRMEYPFLIGGGSKEANAT